MTSKRVAVDENDWQYYTQQQVGGIRFKLQQYERVPDYTPAETWRDFRAQFDIRTLEGYRTLDGLLDGEPVPTWMHLLSTKPWVERNRSFANPRGYRVWVNFPYREPGWVVVDNHEQYTLVEGVGKEAVR